MRRSPSSTSCSDAPLAKSAITRSTDVPQPAIAMPVWPVGTNSAAVPAACAARVSSSAAVILPTAQSLPTVSTTRLVDIVGGAGKERRRGRHAQVPDARIVRVRQRAQLGVVVEKGVQTVDDFELRLERERDLGAIRRRQRAAGRGDADQAATRGRSASSRARSRRSARRSADTARRRERVRPA